MGRIVDGVLHAILWPLGYCYHEWGAEFQGGDGRYRRKCRHCGVVMVNYRATWLYEEDYQSFLAKLRC